MRTPDPKTHVLPTPPFVKVIAGSVTNPFDYDYRYGRRVFWKNDFGPYPPPPCGDTKKQGSHTPLTHSAPAQLQVLAMSQPIRPENAPSADKNTEGHSNPWRILRRPGEAASTRKGTPAPAPAPAPAAGTQVLQHGPLLRIYPTSYDRERSARPTGRHSYRTATKLNAPPIPRKRRH